MQVLTKTETFAKIENLLNRNEVLQLDGADDSYYFGTFQQISQLYETLFDYRYPENEERYWTWISDCDMCSRKKLVDVESIKQLLVNFQRAVQPLIVRGIQTITGETRKIVYMYQPRDWDCTLGDGTLLMGSAKSINTAMGKYDCIVNCTTNIKRAEHVKDVDYIQLLWDDSPKQCILQDLDNVLEKIHVWRTKEHKRVLIHCEQGISRSGACVLAYLLKYHTKNFQNAQELLTQMRPIAKPNSGFLMQLRRWHTK